MRAKVSKLVKAVAQKTHRTSGEATRAHDFWVISAKYALFATFVAAFYILFFPAFVQRLGEWSEAKPAVVLPLDSWRALYHGSTVPCPYDATLSRQCVANPENPVLWKSPNSRSDKDHTQRVKALQGHEFWIGAQVSPELLAQAQRARANQLLLGWVRATSRVWIDGKFTLGGDGSSSEPLIIAIPMTRLAEKRPLSIAIEVFHDTTHPYPDFLNSGPVGEGFMSYMKASAYLSFRAFTGNARPFSLFLANVLIASLFFFLWMSAKVKREYFYISVYSLVAALYQVRLIAFVFLKLSPEVNFLSENILLFFEGSFAMFTGLAFARSREVFFRVGVPACMLAPALIATSLPDSTARFLFMEYLGSRALPAFCLVGAGSCFLQAYFLYGERKAGTYLPVRIKRLILFGMGIFAIGGLYWSQAAALASFTQHAYIYRFGHFFIICFLGFVVFKEYQEQGLLIEKTPVSEYHRRPVLPAKISGAMLVADLKSSEPFYRYRAVQGDSENLVSIWRSHFYTSILKFGGIVIHKKGDEVIGFFDRDRCEDPEMAALKAIDEIAQISRLLENQFKSRNLFPQDAKGLFFRASLTSGDIRPVWESFGGSREAYWEEAGNTMVFVESSRLLELERKVKIGDEKSLLIVPQQIAMRLSARDPRVSDRFILRDQVFKDKHGTEYHVAVYRPESKKSQVKLAG